MELVARLKRRKGRLGARPGNQLCRVMVKVVPRNQAVHAVRLSAIEPSHFPIRFTRLDHFVG
jgi:hypothetical protein